MANQVLEIIKQRHHTGSMPGKRDDPYKLALNVEGGGMRGAVTAGMLAALEALNLRAAFDVVYGSSSGAYSAAFFVGGNSLIGAKFYLNYSQKQFISRKRLLLGKAVFDLKYVQQILHDQAPLNYPGVVGNLPPLHIIATDSSSTKPVVLKGFKNDYEVDRALQASSSVSSFLHPKSFLFKHHRLLDGSIMDPFCIHSAVSEKNSHILVLFSKPWHDRHMPKIVDTRLIRPYLSKVNPHLSELYLHHGEYSFNGLSHIWNHYDGTHMALISPPLGVKVPSNLTTKRKVVAEGYLVGAMSLLRTFDIDDHTQQLIIENFKRELKI